MKRHQHAIYGLYLPDQPDVILYAGSWRVATLDERLRQHRDGECRTTAKMAVRGGVETSDLRMRVLAYWISGADLNPEGEIVLGLQMQGQCRWNHPYAFSTEDNQRGGRIGMSKVSREDHARAGRIGMSKMSREDRARGGRISMSKMSREDRARGGRTSLSKRSPEDRVTYARIGSLASAASGWHQSPEGQAAHIRAGRIGGRKTAENGWHQTPEGQAAYIRAGRIGMSKMSREDHARGGRIANCARWHSDRPKVDRLCAECAAKGTRTVPDSVA